MIALRLRSLLPKAVEEEAVAAVEVVAAQPYRLVAVQLWEAHPA